MNNIPNLNYNHFQPANSSSSDQSQQNQHSYQQFDDDMLQLQSISRPPLHQFPLGNEYNLQATSDALLMGSPNNTEVYDGLYQHYPAPEPPAPAADERLLDPHELSHIDGFLETVVGNSFQLPNMSWGENLFDMSPMPEHTQQFMNNILPTAGNGLDLNGLNGSSAPRLHNNFPSTSPLSQHPHLQPNFAPALSPSPPQLPLSLPQSHLPRQRHSPTSQHNEQPVIVNPFIGHGLTSNLNSSSHLPPRERPFAATAAAAAAIPGPIFGSDPAFQSSGFNGHLKSPTRQDFQRQVRAIMLPNSSDNTAANSPAEIKYEDITGSDAGSNFTGGNAQSPTLSATQSSGVKRRAEDDDDDQQVKARKSRTRRGSTESVPPALPGPSVSKGKRVGKREQLTEAEKRANHIHSEQKRRNHIKYGFDTLIEMVPELRSGGYSKSAILQHVASYVQNLVGDNDKLRDILEGLREQHNREMLDGLREQNNGNSPSPLSNQSTPLPPPTAPMNGNGYL